MLVLPLEYNISTGNNNVHTFIALQHLQWTAKYEWKGITGPHSLLWI